MEMEEKCIFFSEISLFIATIKDKKLKKRNTLKKQINQE